VQKGSIPHGAKWILDGVIATWAHPSARHSRRNLPNLAKSQSSLFSSVSLSLDSVHVVISAMLGWSEGAAVPMYLAHYVAVMSESSVVSIRPWFLA
jgi:hypothetical protein